MYAFTGMFPNSNFYDIYHESKIPKIQISITNIYQFRAIGKKTHNKYYVTFRGRFCSFGIQDS